MENLEQRIQRLEDIEAIKQLKARYLHACDRKDTDRIRDCFAGGDVVIDYGTIGCFTHRDQLIRVFKEMAVNTNVIDAHHGMNPQIKWLDTTKAKAIWDLYFQQINPDQKQITQLTGYYEDKYEKINGEWKITETRFSVSSSVMTQYDTEQLKALHVGAAPSV